MTTGPLPGPWHLPFELAWEALRAGSRPVGAVLYGPEGNVVAAGRNRSREPDAPPGQLAGLLDAPTAEAAYVMVSPYLCP